MEVFDDLPCRMENPKVFDNRLGKWVELETPGPMRINPSVLAKRRAANKRAKLARQRNRR